MLIKKTNKNKNNKLILISIHSYYANQIFNGTKTFEFRKSPLKETELNKKIYVYSAKDDKKIIGYFYVKKNHYGNIEEILKITGYDKRIDKNEIISYFKNNSKCYALELENVFKFNNPITLEQLRELDKSIKMPQYYCFIYESNPIYNLITNTN